MLGSLVGRLLDARRLALLRVVVEEERELGHKVRVGPAEPSDLAEELLKRDHGAFLLGGNLRL